MDARGGSGRFPAPCPERSPWEEEPGGLASSPSRGRGPVQVRPLPPWTRASNRRWRQSICQPEPEPCALCLLAWTATSARIRILSLQHNSTRSPARRLCAMGGPRVLLVTLWALGAAGAAALRIGAFNVQSFGDNKVSDPACSRIIAQILAGYDVALVQEVRDPDLSAVSALMELINSVSKHEYSFVSSEPLGRDQYKEMYLFVYRKNSVSVVDTYQYPDPLHAAPHQAVAEIDALYDVYLDVIDKWGSDDMLFLGDFNADCSYVRAQDWGAIRLRSSEVFRWLIPDSADTTVGNSDCAYDRIVACGARLRRSLKPHSALVHNFQEELGLDQTEALAVSDHFPVEVTLKSH
ncbi:deoxyribonuclease-1-like 2 [Tupaia chinensis]|uniref:deoxyribonuclease-1-like 2 n=1 Tax=Tupaia chinensis TaxID=246437 RepID=UPI000FFC39A4|nr:deoxyribonuclease-1-like 2 [Tupaia chinensis]